MRRKSGRTRSAADASAVRAPARTAPAVGWSDLSDEERTALKRLNRGPYPELPDAVAGRLLALGLAASRPGGTGISRAGRELVIATLLAGRDRDGGERDQS